MVTVTKSKLIGLIDILLNQGMSGKKVLLCIAMGVFLGIFPVVGTTTFLCVAAAFVFRLNLPLIQLVNYAVYPLQLALLAFFYGAGSQLFTGKPLLYSRGEIVELLQNDLWGSVTVIWDLSIYAIFLWMFTGPFIALLLIGILKPGFRKLSSGQHPGISSIKR